MEDGGDDAWGEVLFSTRSRWSDPRDRMMARVLFSIYGLLLVGVSTVFHDEVGPWLTLAYICFLTTAFIILFLHMAKFPPFNVYQRGFSILPSSDLKALFLGGKVAPWDRLKTVDIDLEAEGKLVDSLTFTLEDDEDGYRPIHGRRYNLVEGLSLLNALNQAVPEKLGTNLSRIMEPSSIESMFNEAMGPDAKPEDNLDLEGIHIPILLLPLFMMMAFFMGSFLHSAQIFYFELGRGWESFEALFIPLVATLVMCPFFFLPLKDAVIWRIAKDAKIDGGRIDVRLGRLSGFFYRVNMPMAAIKTVMLNIGGPKDRPYLIAQFSNGEELILPSGVFESMRGHVQSGDNLFKMTYSKGGQSLEGPIVRYRKGGLVILT